MGKTNKFWTGVILGAVAGGVVSLLDKDTREVVSEKCGKAAKNISYILTHPKEVATNVKEKTIELCTTAKEMGEELSYIFEKIEEVRELTPEVTELVKETKEAFVKGSGSQE
ncbi:YtxH domain-containing protein [Bacillus sp. CGMCC 1.16607]|uniref:YtxH domain-containing protein n=1 Tax=Bacillus sp. CGMCC 1.16607 TaxID=3351842 RepID=UPI00363A13CF